MQTHYTRRLLGVALLLVTGGPGAQGGSHDWEDDDHSYDRARRAKEKGEILTLAEIYERAAAQVPGRVLDAELDGGLGHWIYEIKILDAKGRIQELYLDARTGRVLRHGED